MIVVGSGFIVFISSMMSIASGEFTILFFQNVFKGCVVWLGYTWIAPDRDNFLTYNSRLMTNILEHHPEFIRMFRGTGGLHNRDSFRRNPLLDSFRRVENSLDAGFGDLVVAHFGPAMRGPFNNLSF